MDNLTLGRYLYIVIIPVVLHALIGIASSYSIENSDSRLDVRDKLGERKTGVRAQLSLILEKTVL